MRPGSVFFMDVLLRSFCAGILQGLWPPLGGEPSPCYIQFTAKKWLCKGCCGKFSLVFPCAKKLSKVLCSFAIVSLFKYDLWFEYIFRKIFQPVFAPKDVLFRPVQKMIFAVVARAARMRSAGAQHTWVPMRPPETYTFSCARTLSSNTVLYCFFMPTGLQPPRT